MIVLFDGDIGRYRWGWAAERTMYLLELVNPTGYREFTPFETKKAADDYGERVTKNTKATYVVWSRKDLQPVENALQIAKASLQQTLEDITNKYGESDLRIFLSGSTNFRDVVATTKPYKGNRDRTPRPTHYEAIGEYLVDKWSAIYTDGIEADDAIGIAATECREQQVDYCVVSNDKDLDQISGLHYNWITKEFYTVSRKEARLRFYEQLLSGDPTDNVPGLEGIGKVKAKEALAECKSPKEAFESVLKMYREHAPVQWEQYLVEMADLVWIMKKKDEKWSDTQEGKEFCSKYLQYSQPASSSSS